MKMTRVKIKDMFGIKEMELTKLDIELGGDNGTGKTSVLDAIKYALKNKSERKYIIHEGATEGEIIVEMDTGLSIHRKVRKDKADYKMVREGGKAAQDQSENYLRSIFTELQLNPIEFLKMDEKEQNRIILDLIDFKWDTNWIIKEFGEIVPEVDYEKNILEVLHQIQMRGSYYYERREDVNRDARNKKAFIEEIAESIPQKYDVNFWKRQNLKDAFTDLERVRAKNAEIDKAQTEVKNAENKKRAFDAELKIEISGIETATTSTRNAVEKEISTLLQQIDKKKTQLSGLEEKKLSDIENVDNKYRADVAEFQAQIKEHKEKADQQPQDTTELQEKAYKIEKMKSYINEYERMLALGDEVVDLEQESDNYTAKIDHARDLPGEILQNCDIPVANLTIKDGIPLIKGLPVSNLSEGEKLDLCVDIAMQNSESLNLLLIDGIETLSEHNRKSLYEKCKDKGVQVIATRTTDDNEMLVIAI